MQSLKRILVDYSRITAGLGIVFVSLLFILVAVMYPHYGYVQELTVGGGMLQDADKLRDMRLVPMAVAYQLIIIFGLLVSGFKLDNLAKLGFWWLITLVSIALIVQMMGSLGQLLVFGMLGLCFVTVFQTWRDNWKEVTGHILVAATGLTLLCHRILGLAPDWSFVISLATILSIFFVVRAPATTTLLSAAGAVAVAVAVLLSSPVVWLGLPDQHVSALDGLHVLMAATVLVEAAYSIYRIARDRRLCMPNLAVSMAIFLLVAQNIAGPFLPSDDYHFGEKLLAAQTMFMPGEGEWFKSFFSPHGLSDAAGGSLAWFIGDFSATGILIGELIWAWYLSAFLAWLLARRLGPLPAAVLMLVLPLSNSGVILLAINLIAGIEVIVLRRSLLAGGLGALIAFTGVFFNSGLGSGSAIVIGMAGILVQAERGSKPLIRFLTGAAGVSVVLVTIFWAQVVGQLFFLSVSIADNLTIYGNGDTSVFFENLKFFLFALSPSLIFTLGFELLPKNKSITKHLADFIVLAGPFVIFALIFNSYASARLDATGGRGHIITVVLLMLLPIWLSIRYELRQKTFMSSALCAALILMVGNYPPNLRADKLMLPPHRLVGQTQIADDIPQLGHGPADPEHLAMLHAVKLVVDKILEPGETFLNLTNRNALSFYLQRYNPVPFPSPYNAAPVAFQEKDLEAIRKSPPPLTLVQVQNYEHDGLKLPLRSKLLYDFLLQTYEPFVQQGYTYGIRKDLIQRLDRLDDGPADRLTLNRSYSIGNYTDNHWQNGIAIGDTAKRWSFALPPELSGKIALGDLLLFSDGIERRVIDAKGLNVATEPTITSPDGIESLSPTTFSVRNRKLDTGTLWQQALHQGQLGMIPSAWGRSMENLSPYIQNNSQSLELQGTHDIETNVHNPYNYRAVGPDPYWVFVIPKPVSPADYGLLDFTINCESEASPALQLFWRSNAGNFEEASSLHFTAGYKRNFVPLDSTPYWSELPEISEIRIDIDDFSNCPSLNLQNISLNSRAVSGGSVAKIP